MKPTSRKLKLTPWYSGVNPLKSRPGWYECRFASYDVEYWNGEDWIRLDDGKPFMMPPLMWRGVQR